MTVKVLFFARLREIFGETYRFVRVPEGTSVDEIIRILSPESEELLLNKIPLVYAVNQNFEDGEKRLSDQDELAIMMPMSGG